jgi:hypothetical protein
MGGTLMGGDFYCPICLAPSPGQQLNPETLRDQITQLTKERDEARDDLASCRFSSDPDEQHRLYLKASLAPIREALWKIACYDGESIWGDDRDACANNMLEMAQQALALLDKLVSPTEQPAPTPLMRPRERGQFRCQRCEVLLRTESAKRIGLCPGCQSDDQD